MWNDKGALFVPQLRKDPITNRWVIVKIENPQKDWQVTHAEVHSSRTCPFCPGNEGMTPKEIAVYGKRRGGEWGVRVVPNKFPAVRIEETTRRTANGIYDRVGGFGAHEVIIESPEHSADMADFSIEQLELVLRVYRDRCLDLQKDVRLKYILIFKNFGEQAGASLHHPHSQLIGLPIVPSRVLSEVKGAEKHFEYTERCIFCDILEQEEQKLIFLDSGSHVALTPFASRFPFEMWILPKKHQTHFEASSDEDLASLAIALKGALSRLKKALNNPSYNLMIHTSPINDNTSDMFHWHIEIIPKLTEVAGFELGTGFYVNLTPPETAAEILRNQKD